MRFLPTSKKAKIVPYVGGGVDAIFYQYEEYGDFIDFADSGRCPIYADAFVADGTAFGFHALGGLRVYINRDFAIVGEGRYQWAKRRHGRRLLPQRARARQHDRPLRLDGHGRRARPVLRAGPCHSEGPLRGRRPEAIRSAAPALPR